ncbi:MAG: hypothetical protein V4710_24080 [Verrucomicrobiota bacterium]
MSDPSNHHSTPESHPHRYHADPKLSANLRADYEALLNDVKQANELAVDYQRQLAGKSNELALRTQLFERTQKHLLDLNAGIAELRKERHQLANEAMRAEALERKLGEVTAERDQLRVELDALNRRFSIPSDRVAQFSSECDALVDKLIGKVETLTKLLRSTRRAPEQLPVTRNGSSKPIVPVEDELAQQTIRIHFDT